MGKTDTGCFLQVLKTMLRWTVLALLLVTCADVGAQKGKGAEKNAELSGGWGDDISWAQNYDEGLRTIKKIKKPLMIIHHLPDCPHSQALKKEFLADKDIQKMAREDFIMLNLVNETGDKNLYPDGTYVPRILFVDPSLTVRADITGKYSNHLYTYEPGDIDLLVENMR